MNESALPESFDYSTLDEQTREIVLRKTDETGYLPPTIEAIKAAKEAETGSLSPEITAQLDSLQRKVAALTQQRDTLSSQVSGLQELARARESERWEGEHEQRVRLNCYRITSEFQRSLRALFSQWPSPLDVLAFEADDWARLSQIKELDRRLLEECTRLTQVADGRIVDGAKVSAEDAATEEAHA
jgi:hypothetical protein